jgi:hypothetical protein
MRSKIILQKLQKTRGLTEITKISEKLIIIEKGMNNGALIIKSVILVK